MRITALVIALTASLLSAVPCPAEDLPKINVEFPQGFKIEVLSSAKHDAAERDAHVAAAVHPSGCRVDLFFDSSTPVANDQVPEFGQYLLATSAQNLPTMRLGTPGVVTEKGVKIFFVSYMSRDGTEMGTLLIRSFSGSPLRAMVHGPRSSPATEPILIAALEHMMKALAVAAP